MTWKPAAAAAMCAAGLIIGTAASASSPAPGWTTLDRDEFAERYDCAEITPHYWSEATPLLTHRRRVKTTVYMIPGDQTGLVRRGTNKATAAALASYGDLRMVCRQRVPFRTRVRWS